MVERFVGCDWGTSSLRMRLVDSASGDARAQVRSELGVREVFARWRAEGGERGGAFMRVLRELLVELEREAGTGLEGLPVVVSGMASSSIGMRELPYAALPLPLSGDGLVLSVDRPAELDGRPLVLVSGASSAHEVMRGEETQLVGLWRQVIDPPDEALVLLPGTHSKHVVVRQGMVTAFRTFMTGEAFRALATHTVLSQSVLAGPLVRGSRGAFLEGVRAGAAGPLLAEIFRVRTRALLGGADAAANFWYLSGLLIGSELGALRQEPQVFLAAEPALAEPYLLALGELAPAPLARVFTAEEVDRCAGLGQAAVLERSGGR